MLSDLESAMAMIEGQDLQAVSDVKDGWHQALDEASRILKWPEGFIIQYNPANWRQSRYIVGMRLLSDPWTDHLVFEFSTPNYVLPFDCFESQKAKTGVMLHEIAHRIDDMRWNFDLRGLRIEAGNYVTREQRAELQAFACDPVAVFEANLALILSTARMVGLELGDHAISLAAVETVGHAGLAREVDAVDVYKAIKEEGIPVDRILERYLCTFVFSLAGLTAVPELNDRQGLGIKRSQDLTLANERLCSCLRGEMNLPELEEMLLEIDYYVFPDEDHDPLCSLDFTWVDRKMAMENIARARERFAEKPQLADLLGAVEKLEMRLG
jgi:hypothetical protein